MGDVSDMHDLERFMRCPEGRARMAEIRTGLLGRTITDVTFSNEVHFVACTLHLDDGETFFLTQPTLDVDAIRERFEAALDREYRRDYPGRQP